MEITTYAPVYIPTLCRYEHFKRCIESLSACTYAEYTEVYIALDYPAKDSHKEGYKKIVEYLENVGNMNFKNLYVVKRERNYGFGHNGNAATMVRYLREHYDRYISSEDDNVFSPNFLVFMNKALELYKDEPLVNSVCGYNYNVDMHNLSCNYYFSKEYSAWGTGHWSNNVCKFDKCVSVDYLQQILFDTKSLLTIYNAEPRLINTLIMLYQTNQLFGDTMRVSYQYLSDTMSIFPRTSLVRNLGFDGSGTTINKTINSYAEQIIDTNPSIEITKRSAVVDEDAMEYVKKYMSRPVWMNFIIYVRMFIHKWTKFDILSGVSKWYNRGNTKIKP